MASDDLRVHDVLRQRSVLGRLPDEALAGLIGRGRPVRFAKGEALYRRGDAGESMIVIVAGRVKISNVTDDAREVILNFLGPGDLIGEMAALDGSQRSADATALDTVAGLLFYRRDMIATLERHPEALLGIVAELATKLRRTSAMIEHGVLQMSGRAARGLLRLAEQHGREAADGMRLEIKLSQKDLGSYLGLSRENTSRELSRLREAGLIRVEGGEIVIIDRAGLEAWATAEA
ncbi:MAG: Crp/Fnr family transcriptional regulator [Hyphomicrobiaceae bacterium]